LEIALVNNMPDAALMATERQFASLLAEAAGEAFDVRLRLYALAKVPRSETAQASMKGRYGGLDDLEAAGADALIVTGCEPKAAELRDEPYWPELAELIDWAALGGTRSTVFSCLAAHAAALHLDGIERRRLTAKTTGVFAFDLMAKSPLTRGMKRPVRMPHSRHNTLEIEALSAHGYEVLTHGPDAGVDICTRPGGGLLVFLQGHPEYAPDSMLREYRRDVGRCLRGEQSSPACPRGYFDPATERMLVATAEEALRRGRPELLQRCDVIAAALQPAAPWRSQAVRLYHNWLEQVAAAQADHEAAAGARCRELTATSLGELGQAE
jgi:homoserine O-succinyltransferase